MIAGGQKDALYTRAILLDTLRSVSRAIFLDADHGEEFTRVQTTFSGVSDILDRSANRLAAATEIPVTLLMGQAPAGLNATGASDVRIFYDLIKSQQANELSPKLMRLIRLFAIGAGYRNERFKIEYHPLWQETPAEQATRRQSIATADAIYIQNEVFTPEEVAKVRGRATGWDGPIAVNLALRESPDLGEGPATLVPPGPKPPMPPPPGG
jgi:phage-related protein (TIGR01555 family)